jgi:DNA mismatch endonuclease (patch repair protein)
MGAVSLRRTRSRSWPRWLTNFKTRRHRVGSIFRCAKKMADVFPKSKRSWIMARILGKDTQPERAVRHLLYSNGFRYRLNVSGLPGNPDLVLSRYRTAVFVNGCFWHAHKCQKGRVPKSNRAYWSKKLKRNVERDARNKKCLKKLGWKVVVVWSCELRNPSRVEERLLSALRKLPS